MDLLGRGQYGSARLKDEQVASYLDIAREHGFDGVLTISTEITATSDESPVAVDGRKLRTTGLWHLVVVEGAHRGGGAAALPRHLRIPDQEWVLRELIHYLGRGRSGAVGFEDMGENSVPARGSSSTKARYAPASLLGVMSQNGGSSSRTTSR